jgi:DNA-binding GntR family transcriptional regulator
MQYLTALDNPSLRERVYQALREALVSGELPPGQRLRDQELAAQLGVSRTPVREALQRLEDEGLVETSPRALTRVSPLDARAAREAFPVVAALHALAARSGAPRLTPAELEEMRAANTAFAAAIAAADPSDPDTIARAIAADDRFHGVLLSAADNEELMRALERLMSKVRRLEYAQFGSLAGRRSVQQHEAIIAACALGSAAEAAQLVEDNWLSLGRLIEHALTRGPSDLDQVNYEEVIERVQRASAQRHASPSKRSSQSELG